MKQNEIIFDSIVFDKEAKTFTILDGDIGTYSIKEVKKVQILAERASKRGKSKSFTYTVLLTPNYRNLFEHSFYLGLKITMKDNTDLAVYLHKVKTYTGTDIYIKAKKEADNIKNLFERYKEKFKKEEGV